jgi:5-oxoprolinase (ATP-hydrolysing)
MTAAILSGHRLVRPHGMAGGEPGAAGKNYVLRADGRRTELGPFDQTEMGAGDVFVIETPGGGGFGAIEYGSKAKKQGQKQKHE